MIMPVVPLYVQWRKREYDNIAWDNYMNDASPLPTDFRSTPEQRMFVEFLRIERNLQENEEFIPEFMADYSKWIAEERAAGNFNYA